MKIEKVEKQVNKYPKIKEINIKHKIEFMTSLLMLISNKSFAASLSDFEVRMIPGEMPQEYSISKVEAITQKTLILIVLMLLSVIVSIISLVRTKVKWDSYSQEQKKQYKIILSVIFAITLILIVSTVLHLLN